MNTRGKYADRLAPVLRRAHRDFLLWKKLNKKQCSQPRFTPARCNRTVQTSFLAFVQVFFFASGQVVPWYSYTRCVWPATWPWGFPCLQSKAAASKILTFWLAQRAIQLAKRQGATETDKVMASCMFSYMRMLQIMDEGGLLLTEEQAVSFHYFTLRHLQCYKYLHSIGFNAALNIPGRRCWLLLPKLHFKWHLAFDVLKLRVNPKMVMLLSAESFVGVMGRISRATHRATVSRRTLERYLVQLNLKIKHMLEC